ncbi:GPO family capsid scaffolding protein [Brevundimonas sp. BH3]|uniref:GPO family capsid scaffolding protein n=1 Tax=Brevundimonas sp. BH3 TaxID=3133089 RepID=UPI003243D7BD
MADKTANKSRFFRVAVEGATASDGRTIERAWLEQAASSYNRETYAARVNMEHIRGYTGDGPFKAYGDVLAVRTQEDTIKIDGKDEKRLALYAQIDPTDELVTFNKARQKIYTSIEIEPNFANTGKAYLMGLAATDSPASLGTEALQFSHSGNNAFAKTLKADLDRRKQTPTCVFSALHETSFELEQASEPTETVIEKIANVFARALGQTNDTPVNPASVQASTQAPVQTSGDNTQLASALKEFSTQIGKVIADGQQDTNARFARLETQFNTLKTDLENTPENGYRTRPLHAGGDGMELTDC